MVHIDKKQAMQIFGLLFVFTALEIGIVYIPGIDAMLLIAGLVGMACAKAGLVGMYYMHLKHETEMLQWSIVIPMLVPALYAFVLVVEAAYRLVF